MRLLYYTSDKELRWTEDLIGDDKLPPYAILSHTWQDGQEVTFDDLKTHNGKDKAGFDKIRFCAQQAERDGLRHFWVDTCCIDKSSSAELSEAINSMFRWYHKAERCYVYLADVSNTTSDGDGEASRRWKPAFRRSRWFTRGWTLQELIAPASVEFFSKENERLGDKQSLEQTIHEITGLPIKALRGSPPCNFSKDDRFSWAATRETTREEDEAYCLLGIFDIQIPLLYGEGRQKAMKRLREEVWKTPVDLPTNKICQWLSAPDPSTNYQKALEQRQEDTGLWFLESDRYAKWKTDAASFLWLYGIPGCGKTILSSTILQNVFHHCANNRDKVVAYFYFDFNDVQKQNPELMPRSLICQLLQQCIKIPASLDTLFSSRGNGQQQLTLHALVEVLRQMILEFPHVYIILDALDECSERSKLMDIIETIAAWRLQNLHVLVTSRSERDIQSSLETFMDRENAISLQSEVVDVDIQRYVQKRLSEDKRLNKWGKDLALSKEIENALMNGAHGMFRWAVCQLDTLIGCRTRATLRKSLATLPPTLDKTYDRILSTISDADSQYAVTILQWLTFSARPLSIYEVAEIVAIDVKDESKFDREGALEDPLDVLSICSSLVTITMEKGDEWRKPSRQVVVLAHYSVKEYLLSDRISKGSAARYGMQDIVCHDNIAKSCLVYLLQFQEKKALTQDTVKDFKLAEYCAEFWIEHVQHTKEQTEGLSQAVMNLLSEKGDAYLNWLRIHDPDKPPWERPRFQKSLESVSAPLYYASKFGLRRIVELLLDKGADVNEQGNGYYGNALQAAVVRSHKEVVELLVSKGADVNVQGGYFINPLQAAAAIGHKEVVKLLVSKGADVNAQGGGSYGNALQEAAARGHKEIVELLVSKGADVNMQGGHYSNALQVAAAIGHKEIVELLVSKGVDVNVQGGHYDNALQAAAAGGHKEMAELLVSKGADVNVQGGGHYSNALQAAAAGGNKEIVELLVSKGADVSVQGGDDGNALQAAAARGHKEVVELLVSKGADVNVQGGEHYSNALQAAAAGGHKEVIELLVSKGADVNMQVGGDYSNALQVAAARGHKEVVELLVSKGADVNMQGGKYYSTALQAAAAIGYKEVVELLVSKGADVNMQGDGLHSNALQAAAAGGNKEIVELLVSKGADVNMHGGGYYSNALQVAAARGNKKIVELLVSKGANVNMQGGGHYSNALQVAAYEGHKEMVELLVSKGADVNMQGGGDYGNALQAAAAGGHKEIVELLVSKGVDVNMQGGDDGNALQAAAAEGHKEVVELLVSKGADVNVQGGDYGNALQAAAAGGHKEVVELLVSKDVDVNVQGGDYGNALQAAAAGGHKEVVELLVGEGADVNMQGGHYGNAFQAAAAGGNKEIVELLVSKGVDVNAQGGHCGNALQAAALRGHKDIVELLISKGADVNVQGGHYGNALQAAATEGYKEVVELLVDSGAVTFEKA